MFEHAAREPKFAAFVEDVHQLQVDLTDEIVGQTIPDQRFRPWVTRTIVGYLVDSVLAWLEVGDPELDAQFIEQASGGLVALYLTWAPDTVPAIPDPK